MSLRKTVIWIYNLSPWSMFVVNMYNLYKTLVQWLCVFGIYHNLKVHWYWLKYHHLKSAAHTLFCLHMDVFQVFISFLHKLIEVQVRYCCSDVFDMYAQLCIRHMYRYVNAWAMPFFSQLLYFAFCTFCQFFTHFFFFFRSTIFLYHIPLYVISLLPLCAMFLGYGPCQAFSGLSQP